MVSADRSATKILDAAVAVLTDHGVKRTTVDLIANQAGVSHMTIYRRWSTKNDVLRAAIVREFEALLDDAFAQAAVSTRFAERVVEAFTALLCALDGHPFVAREIGTGLEALASSSPDVSSIILDSTVPLLIDRLALLADEPIDDVDTLADVFVRLGHSLLLVQRTDRPMRAPAAVADYARLALGPLAESVAPEAEVALTSVSAGVGGARRMRLPLVAASVAALLLGGGLLARPVAREVMHTDVVDTVSSSATPTPPSAPTHPSENEPAPTQTLDDPPAAVVPPRVSTPANPPISNPEDELPVVRAPRAGVPARATPGDGGGSGTSPSFRPRPPAAPGGAIPPGSAFRPPGAPGSPGSSGPSDAPGGAGAPGPSGPGANGPGGTHQGHR